MLSLKERRSGKQTPAELIQHVRDKFQLESVTASAESEVNSAIDRWGVECSFWLTTKQQNKLCLVLFNNGDPGALVVAQYANNAVPQLQGLHLKDNVLIA